MIGFARRYAHEPAAAEDVVLGLLGRWLERPPAIRDEARLSAFLATSVYHAAIDWLRHERAAQGMPPRALPDGEANYRPPAAREDLRDRLAEALSKMPADDRLLLESHYGRALTTEECMELLGIKRAAFHQRAHRARKRLAELMR